METPNLSYIQELADGSEAFEAQLLGIIKKEFPQERELYDDHIAGNDLEQAAFMTHKLKHKIGMLGFVDGYQLAIEHEEALKQEDSSLHPKFISILDAIGIFLANES